MDIKMGYETLLARHPEAVEQAVAKLRKSRSKYRNADPATLSWRYSWGVVCKSYSAADLFNGKARAADERHRAMTIEERINDEARRSRVTLGVSTGYYSDPLEVVPPEIMNRIRADYLKEQEDEARVAALTPEQREKEVEGLLRQLQGPGFFTFSVK